MVLAIERPVRPIYGEPLRKRIEAARARAYGSKRRAWEFGPKSPYTGDRHYYVGSFSRKAKSRDDEDPGYIVTVYAEPYVQGAFVYSLGLEPVVWISCECDASRNSSPCKHGARVQLRLEREAKEESRSKPEAAQVVKVKEVRLW